MTPEVGRQHREYLRVCEKLGIRPRTGGEWFNHSAHVAQLEAGLRRPVVKPAAPRTSARKVNQYAGWWLQRFTMREIREMAGALEFLS